jgi:preprotein translocase subunit SecA
VTGSLVQALFSVARGREANGARHGIPAGQEYREFPGEVRSYDLTGHSDGDLRNALLTLDKGVNPVESATFVFAVVAETIDRRLGVWRLFDDPSTSSAYPLDNGMDHPDVREGLDQVAKERKYRRLSAIHLRASFYRAIRSHDAGQGIRFRVTDEQLLAGFHMFRGSVVQMNAGEGKTVAAAFPAVLHALFGASVHIITANDYLADRDAALLGPVYESLGLTSGAVLGHMEDEERRYAYRSQVVYGTMREFGFDYLRDNLKAAPGERVQGNLEVAIIDEVDHALIDEAFTPMIISGNPSVVERPVGKVKEAVSGLVQAQHDRADRLAENASCLDVPDRERWELLARLMLAKPEHPALQKLLAANPRDARRVRSMAGEDGPSVTRGLMYAVDPDLRFVTVTDEGWEFLEKRLGRIYDRWSTGAGSEKTPSLEGLPLADRRKRRGGLSRRVARQYSLGNYVHQMLRAFLLLKRDVDYIVDDDAIVLIDQQTGRPKTHSVFQFSLHSALESKEGVTIRPERDTLGQISVAAYIGQYGHTSGMTGTAVASANEFERKYGMNVVVVPPSNYLARVDSGPRLFRTREDKLGALVDEVAARHRVGQPVLVGTGTVEQSEELSQRLAERGIPHNLLNAVATGAEAQIVRDAGRFGAVTVATNMAGRGTDILLEPGLNRLITRWRLDLIKETLTGETTCAVVPCHSLEQAQALREELDRTPGLDAAGDGREVSITRRGGSRHGTGGARLQFSLGLCVIGADMHNSTRVHLQLNGRSGRQGGFGETVSFLSLEDRIISLRAVDFLRLSRCRKVDAAGREYFTGAAISNLVDRLRRDAEGEGEAQRGLMQDYFAVPDLHTCLFYRRRQEIAACHILNACREIALQQASDMVSRYFGTITHDQYVRRFQEMTEEAQLDFGVGCADLYGCGLDVLAEELGRALIRKIEESLEFAGAHLFGETARLLYLQTCDELWREHLALLRDSMSNHTLAARNHKSAVAAYVRDSGRAWDEFWRDVNTEFLVRLTAFPFSARRPELERPTPVSEQVEMLLAELPTPAGATAGSD